MIALGVFGKKAKDNGMKLFTINGNLLLLKIKDFKKFSPSPLTPIK